MKHGREWDEISNVGGTLLDYLESARHTQNLYHMIFDFVTDSCFHSADGHTIPHGRSPYGRQRSRFFADTWGANLSIACALVTRCCELLKATKILSVEQSLARAATSVILSSATTSFHVCTALLGISNTENLNHRNASTRLYITLLQP